MSSASVMIVPQRYATYSKRNSPLKVAFERELDKKVEDYCSFLYNFNFFHHVSEKSKKKQIVDEEIEKVAKDIRAGGTDLKNDPVLRENINLDNVAIVNKVQFLTLMNGLSLAKIN